MAKKEKVITCIIANNMRKIISMAQELEIKREDIVNILAMEGQIYLVFYK